MFTFLKKLTLDQLRAVQDAGGVKSVTLEALGREFLILINRETQGSAQSSAAVLAVKNTGEIRTFVDPRRALKLLREIGIRQVEIDATHWMPK